MNVRIFWVCAMKCMCAQTRPRFILSSEGVFGGMEFEPMLTPREKSPLPENVPWGGSNKWHCGQRAQALPTELFRPPVVVVMMITITISLKGAIRDFWQSPRCSANCLQQVRWSGPGRNRVQSTCNTSSAFHVQRVVLRATLYEGTAQLLSLAEFKSHLFYLLSYWLNH